MGIKTKHNLEEKFNNLERNLYDEERHEHLRTKTI